jgi:NAD-dependent deacetylase
MRLLTTKYKAIVVLTGAGISAASGLRTYRGPDGLWSDPETAKFSSIEGFRDEPDRCWQFWSALRLRALSAAPNEAHLTLAKLEQQLAEQEKKFTLITQNVDELHQRAGNQAVVELHGSIFFTRCSNDRCDLKPFRQEEQPRTPALCSFCKELLRPNIVLFNEPIPGEAEWRAKRAFRDCDLFIAIGTSGTVSPASSFVQWAKYAEATTVLVNLEAPDGISPFDKVFIGRAEELLPQLFF